MPLQSSNSKPLALPSGKQASRKHNRCPQAHCPHLGFAIDLLKSLYRLALQYQQTAQAMLQRERQQVLLQQRLPQVVKGALLALLLQPASTLELHAQGSRLQLLVAAQREQDLR